MARSRSRSRSQVNRSLRSLIAKRRLPMTAFHIIDKFEADAASQENDWGVVLVSVALVEQFLEDAILVHCLKSFEKPPNRDRLFGGDPATGGAVNSFAGKITLGHALGIYGENFRSDLDRLRRIRNAFAHAKGHIGFKSKAIRNAVMFNIFDPKFDFISPSQRTDSPKKMFVGAVGISMIFLYTMTNKNRRYRPRARPNKTFFYS